MIPIKSRAILLAGGLATALLFSSGVQAAGADSGLNSPVFSSAVNLLNSVRPHLVSQLALHSRQAHGNASGSTRFEPSGDRLIVSQLVHVLAANPTLEKVYLPAIERGLADYQHQMADSGLANDVAGAMALFVAAADLGYRERQMTNAQSDVVIRQLQSALDTPEMRGAGDRPKQELYEFLATFGLYILITHQVAIEQHNENALTQLKPIAGQALQWLLQVSPESIAVGDNGLSLPAGAVATLVGPAPSATTTQVPSSPPSATTTGQDPIVGIWHGVGTGTSVGGTTNAAGTGYSTYGITSGLKVRDVAFLADGWFTSAIPAEGVINLDHAATAARNPTYWGRYTFDGHGGVINFVSGSPSKFEIINGKLYYERFEYAYRRPLR